MAELTNSHRAVFKATYVPTNSQSGPSANTARVMEKVSFLRQLNLLPAEIDQLAKNPVVQTMAVNTENVVDNPFGARASTPLLDIVRVLVTDVSSATTQQYAPLLMLSTPDQLAAFGREVAHQRQAAADHANQQSTQIVADYGRAVPGGEPSVANAMNWAVKTNNPAVEHLYTLATQHARSALTVGDKSAVASAVAPTLQAKATGTQNLVNGFLDGFKIEPIGRIHLERVEMTPVGIEHGELVHSVPLTPHETVNISHREWSVSTQTFETLVQDSFEGFSEQGVTEKTDIAQATATESRHQSALDVNGSVSASYQGGAYSVTASAGVDYNTHSDDTRSAKDSLAHSMAITRAASARTRKDHKTSFRTSSVAGTEDMAVRTLTNTTDNAIRVDYYQLMRKWRVDLIRYGLRMTYDIVVPNPGNDLSQKVLELQLLTKAIAEEHKFTVPLNQVTRDTWMKYAEQLGAAVDPPPVDPIKMMQTPTLQRAIDQWGIGTIPFDMPDGYQVTRGEFWAEVHVDVNDAQGGHLPQISLKGEAWSGQFSQRDGTWGPIPLTAGSIIGQTGNVALEYSYYNVSQGGAVAKIEASPTNDAMQAWQVKAWNQLREADQAAYEAGLTRLQDRRRQLEAEIGEFDALTLRKMEREEIMKGVLRWLFGPSFQLQPGALDQVLTDPQQSVFQVQNTGAWETIMQYGEFIKYIHNAIEWENVLFFPYPYFWDATTRWPFKQFLMHPDLEHRTFLRAGCARVVLTIRPGFEQSFAQLIETGSFAVVLQGDHPYVSIGQEIRNFAMTNYEALPPANPDHNVRPLLYPEQRKAWGDMQQLMLLLEAYSDDAHANNNALDPSVKVYPTTQQGLAALKLSTNLPEITAIPQQDPWGRAYRYISPGLHGDYDLVCNGANGQEGGEGLDADITSWAEGSVIATWFEYTPTSALDVVVNSTLPTTPQPA